MPEITYRRMGDNGGNNLTPDEKMVVVMTRIARDLERVIVGIFACGVLLGLIACVLIVGFWG